MISEAVLSLSTSLKFSGGILAMRELTMGNVYVERPANVETGWV